MKKATQNTVLVPADLLRDFLKRIFLALDCDSENAQVVAEGLVEADLRGHRIQGTDHIYSIVAEVLVRNRVSVPVVPMGLDGRYFKPGRLPDVLEYEGFSVGKLTGRFRRALEEHGGNRPVAVPAAGLARALPPAPRCERQRAPRRNAL